MLFKILHLPYILPAIVFRDSVVLETHKRHSRWCPVTSLWYIVYSRSGDNNSLVFSYIVYSRSGDHNSLVFSYKTVYSRSGNINSWVFSYNCVLAFRR